MKKFLTVFLALCMLLSIASAVCADGSVAIDKDIEMLDAAELDAKYKKDQDFTLADPAPWNLEELKQVVDVKDPRSVAAYFVWAVTRMTDNYNDGNEMMKYLFADIEPYGRGYTEGGMSGKAGWDTYFNDRLKSDDYKWLPRAYFEGAEASNGFIPDRPLTIELYYNNTNTETINAQTLEQLGRLNIVYWVMSHAAGNKVNITVSKFDGSDRWYVTSGGSSQALFYDQRSALTQTARNIIAAEPGDSSTKEEHAKRYGGAVKADPEEEPKVEPSKDKEDSPSVTPSKDEKDNPFTDVPAGAYFTSPVLWALNTGVTAGTSATTFGPMETCTRGQVVTFLWRAAGKPEPTSKKNPFTDVKSSDYFHKAVLWAVQEGITAGTSADEFSPDQTCSSAHIITFLFRAMGEGPNGWYEEAKGWAEDNDLLDGTGINVSPSELCPRGAVVTFLSRIYGD